MQRPKNSKNMEKNQSNKNTIIGVVVVVLLIVIVAVVVLMGNHDTPVQSGNTNSQTTQPVNGQQTAPATASYTATADGFSVNFPGTPNVESNAINSPTAGSISETDYTFVSSANGKGILYMIIVFHYPTTYQFSSNYLTGALQMFNTVINTRYPGTKVSAEPASQFLGSSAISASVTVPFMGTPTPGNVLITTKNHNTYIVSAYGLSQDDYNTFLNSFTFTK
jgi:hypothetical protein